MYRKRHREIVVDINKILFEQLNLQGVQNPFTVDEISGSDAVQKETTKENTEIKQQISSALNVEDEDSSLQIGNKKSSEKLNSAVLNTQNLMNMLSNETQRYNKEEKEIEKEIQSKSEEYQKLAEEIQAKQEEYEKLISEAESSNDESVISNANSLGEEINSMVSDLENIKTNIENLESSLSSKQSISNMFNSQLNSLSKVQSTLNNEVIKESAVVNSVSAADAVQEVNVVNEVKESAQTQETIPVRQHVEIKSMEEYKEILDGKFNELWEKYGDADSVVQYVKNNPLEFADVTGDGKIDAIDAQIIQNYKGMLPVLSSSDNTVKDKGWDYVKVLHEYAKTINQTVSSLGINGTRGVNVQNSSLLGGTSAFDESAPHNYKMSTQTYTVQYNHDTTTYTLEDLENYKKLGGSPQKLLNSLDYSSIVKEEDWEARYKALFPQFNHYTSNTNYNINYLEQLKTAEEFVKNNPEKAGYADLAVKYKMHQKNGTNISKVEVGMLKDGCFDINSDGNIDVTDYISFSTDIDLDGDGVVSAEEKKLLETTKMALKQRVYSDIESKSANNLLSFDEMIKYFENFEHEEFRQTEKNNAEKTWNSFSSSINLAGSFTWNKSVMSSATGRNNLLYSSVVFSGTGLNDGTPGPIPWKSGDGWQYDFTIGITDGYAGGSGYSNNMTSKDMYEMWEKAYEFTDPKNTYLHYISSADLSKEDLKSMLNKINSASVKVQNQLAEVKTLIEQKLAGL